MTTPGRRPADRNRQGAAQPSAAAGDEQAKQAGPARAQQRDTRRAVPRPAADTGRRSARPDAETSRPQPTALGTQRRLQALMNRSWSPQAIERATGIPAIEIARALADQRGTSPALDERVAAAYDRLWNQPPPLATARDRDLADRASALAQRHGWPPPMAYDDDLIDLPSGCAEPGWRRRRGTSHRSVDLAEDIAFVREHGRAGSAKEWEQARLTTLDGAQVPVNEYFLDHLDAGTRRHGRGQRRLPGRRPWSSGRPGTRTRRSAGVWRRSQRTLTAVT